MQINLIINTTWIHKMVLLTRFSQTKETGISGKFNMTWHETANMCLASVIFRLTSTIATVKALSSLYVCASTKR